MTIIKLKTDALYSLRNVLALVTREREKRLVPYRELRKHRLAGYGLHGVRTRTTVPFWKRCRHHVEVLCASAIFAWVKSDKGVFQRPGLLSGGAVKIPIFDAASSPRPAEYLQIGTGPRS